VSASRRVLRVLLVDDSETFLAGASVWVSSQPGLVLAGTAHSGAEALIVADDVRPDLVLMDAAMHGIDGFEATRRLKARESAPQVVLLTSYDTLASRRDAWACGADGFVAKADVSARLLEVIRKLFEIDGLGDDGAPSRSPRVIRD
jgi:DNA-binding NarL/FixJ family response regulator